MSKLGWSAITCALTLGVPGFALGGGDASSDAAAARTPNHAGGTPSMDGDRQPFSGVGTVAEAAPLGASDAAMDAAAARARERTATERRPVVTRASSLGSPGDATESLSPIGAGDASSDAYALTRSLQSKGLRLRVSARTP
jgi:hypothetical protein